MSEPNEGCALLEDVEESTFIRFSQYAYTGEYIAADPEILVDSSTIARPSTWSKPAPSTDNAWLGALTVEESPSEFNTASTIAEAGPSVDTKEPEVGDVVVHLKKKELVESKADQEFLEWQGYPGPFVDTKKPEVDDVVVHLKKKKKSKKEVVESKADPEFFKWESYPDERESGPQSRKERLWKLFVGRSYNVSTPSFHCRRNRESCEDYTDVFLCHARLYVFADKWDIGLLKQLCLHKLHQTLSVFTLYEERVGDIVTLMRYIYNNTFHSSSTEDPLRSLLIHYATCVVETLVQSSEFKALLLSEEARELASDLIVKMINRLD